MIRLASIFICFTWLVACRPTRVARDPSAKFSISSIQEDYTVFRNTLEKYHPSLYWYSSKDSMDYYFNWGQQQLKDSMTEPDFYKVLSYVMAKIHCGHSTVKNSKYLNYYLDTAKHRPLFPLSVKIWKDTVLTYGSLNRADSLLYGGAIIVSINNVPTKTIVDSLIKFVSTDGYNENHLYQWLSNRGNFANLYTTVFGLAPSYKIDFIDKNNTPNTTVINNYIPAADTNRKKRIGLLNKPSKQALRKQKLNDIRSIQIDTVGSTAIMRLNSFGNGYHLKSFFKNVFKTLNEKEISNLVIDVRTNGGGNVTNAIKLSRYLTSAKIKAADSIYATNRCIQKNSHIQKKFQYQISMLFASKRKWIQNENGSKNTQYHFTYFEKHQFKPVHHNFFKGNAYIITGANSFSATSIFVNIVAKEKNIWTVGEETGGGAYGNSGFMIPDVLLPNTKMKFRLPLFRMVANAKSEKTGRGIYPEIPAIPTVSTIRKGVDIKTETVLEKIKSSKIN